MEKNFSKYQKIIIQVAKKFHEQKNDRPRKVDYCSEVVKIFNSIELNTKVTKEKARSQISRVIDKLSEGTNNKLLCINGKYYVYNNKEYLKEKTTEEYYSHLKDKIKVLRSDILKISHNMCAVLVEPKDVNTKIVKVFSKCLGENCFKVTQNHGMVFIMIKCNPNDNYIPTNQSSECVIMKAIEDTIMRIYQDQEKKGLKPLKRKRKQKQKKDDISQNPDTGS